MLHRLAIRHHPLAVWWGTSVEVMSAFARLARMEQLPGRSLSRAMSSLAELRATWLEIAPSERVRSLAESIPQRYHLRAGDALQLAAALVWCNQHPRGRPFVCFDRRLGQAATEAGFTVIGAGARARAGRPIL